MAEVLNGLTRVLFVSVATYELGKRLGVEAAARDFVRQCEAPQRGDLPAARMVARLRQLGAIQLFHGAGSCLPKMRSRAAHAAWQSKADLWIQLDDDVECDMSTLERLVFEAGPPDEARAVVLPCRVRGTEQDRQTVNVRWKNELTEISRSGPIRRVELGGTGCMVLTRAALEAVRTYTIDAYGMWLDDDGIAKAPLFQMLLRTPRSEGWLDTPLEWLNEDYSFCRRLEAASVPIVAPRLGVSFHDGVPLVLDNA